MADNIDPQQIDNLNKNLEDLVKTLGGTVSKSDGLTQSLGEQLGISKEAMKGLKGLGTGASDLTKTLYNGKQGMEALGGAVDMVASGLELIIALIPGMRLLKIGLMLTVEAFSTATKTISKQGDALYKTYQDLQKSGATAADGITGVFNNMQNFGYGIEELDKMVKLVAENSETLAKFSLTAADGTNAFASAMTGLVRDQGLKELGKTPDQINAAGAAFIRQTVRAGLSQKDVGDQLANQTKKYVMDLDRLQRLTGIQADTLQKQQDEAMAEDAYNDVVSELKQRALAGDKVAEAQLEKITTVMSKLGPEMRKEFILSLGGDISAGPRLFSAMPSLVQNVMNETVSLTDTMKQAGQEAKNTAGNFGLTARLAAQSTREFIGPLYEIREFAVSAEDFAEKEASAKKQTKIIDQSTKNLAKIDLSNMNSRDALQSFVQLGVEPATNALAEFANIARGGSQMLPGQGPGAANSWSKNLENLNDTNKSLLGVIRQGESQGNYNALVYGKKGFNTPKEADLTNMTIAQVQEYQKGMLGRGHASTAVGAYQMIANTLSDQVKKSGLDPNTTKFDQKTQDLLASQLVKQAGYGRLDPATVMKNLSGTWASLPKNMSGSGSYDGQNGNQVGVDPKLLYDAISKRDNVWASANLKQLLIGIYGDASSRNNISGPSNSYDSKMSEVKPDKTLPPKEMPTTPQESQSRTQSDDILDIMRSALVSLDRKMGDVADNTKAIKQSDNR